MARRLEKIGDDFDVAGASTNFAGDSTKKTLRNLGEFTGAIRKRPSIDRPIKRTSADITPNADLKSFEVPIKQTNRELVHQDQNMASQNQDIVSAREKANLSTIGSSGLDPELRDPSTLGPQRGLEKLDGSQSPYDVTFASDTSEAAQDAFNQTPLSGGSRRRSNLPGKNERLGLGPIEKPDERKTKLWEIATTSKFPKQRRTAMEGLKLLEGGEQFDTASDEKQDQFDITSSENKRQFDLQEERTRGQSEIANLQGAERLGIDRMRADTDAAYKKYQANKPDPRNSLSKDQYMSHDRKNQQDWVKRTAADSLTSQPNDFMDAGGTTPIDYKVGMYRDNPQKATEMYGPPEPRTAALISLNMNPKAWASYTAATPEQQQQMLDNYIAQKG